MPATPTAGALFRSQIETLSTKHLSDASNAWRVAATASESGFNQHRRNIDSPGGTTWEGDAKDNALERVTADIMVVSRQGAVLREAADLAEEGARDIEAAKVKVLEAISAAEDDGFRVGEDLSVTDARRADLLSIRARQICAYEHAEYIRWTAEQLAQTDRLVGNRLHTKAAELDAIQFGEDRAVQAVGWDVPLAPPPNEYPINDVIAEATDLDGNHIVLRRGYYDAATQQGFGADKALWRHGVQAHIFEDLITHGRPIENISGTLVYEIPIERWTCKEGFLGLVDCNDTGESLTMRIVVNTNPSFGVPDGGQKGVITMYPLEGGDGVRLLGPNWTYAPPWVNNNAPIN